MVSGEPEHDLSDTLVMFHDPIICRDTIRNKLWMG